MYRCKRECPFPDEKDSLNSDNTRSQQAANKRLCTENSYHKQIVIGVCGRSEGMDWQDEIVKAPSCTSSQQLSEYGNNNNTVSSSSTSLCSRCQSGEAGHYSHIGR